MPVVLHELLQIGLERGNQPQIVQHRRAQFTRELMHNFHRLLHHDLRFLDLFTERFGSIGTSLGQKLQLDFDSYQSYFWAAWVEHPIESQSTMHVYFIANMHPPYTQNSAEFRAEAEARLQTHPANGKEQPIVDLLRLQHELQVNQVELEMQNENLQEQLDELLRWQKVMLAREERVQVLKSEVNELLAQKGLPARYPSQVEES